MEKRNMASSKPQLHSTPEAVWSLWTTEKAVSEGYKISGWVYRAVSMISKHVASIPWCVEDANGNKLPEHPISILLNNPNPEFSRQDFFELIAAWQQLSGLAYTKKVFNSDDIVEELWPISPDRLSPITGGMNSKLIEGYEVDDGNGNKKKSADLTEENVISFRYLDPSDPARGIGPLQVAARAVDVDMDQLNWNKAAMQNRGVLDGIFTFQRDLDPSTYDTVKQKIKELFSGPKNARDIGVIGSNATYQRLSLTPAEMDFLKSRRFNREEIFIIFGIPPQLAGVQDASTYNNYATSMRIFWELTLVPILDDMAATFNFSLRDQLGEGLKIKYDISKVPAMKQTHREKVEISRMYHDMGVPMKALNEMFALGVPEYDGWELSKVTEASRNTGTNEARSTLTPVTKIADKVFDIMDETKDLVLRAMDEDDVRVRSSSVMACMSKLRECMASIAMAEKRDTGVAFDAELTTMGLLSGVLRDGAVEQKSSEDIKQAVVDLGIFSRRRSEDFAQIIHDSPVKGDL